MYDNSNAPKVTITANKTLALADAGVIQRLAADALVITLPSATTVPAGTTYTVAVAGVKPTAAGPVGQGTNKSVGFVLAPNAADGIAGIGFTPAVNKGASYAKATSRVLDFIQVTNSAVAGATAWTVSAASGPFVRVA